MFELSRSSQSKLDTCSNPVQGAVLYALCYIDVGVLDGHRDEDTQNLYYVQHKSKVKFPNSKHNAKPSDAVDLTIYVKGLGYIDEKTCPKRYRQYYGYLAGLLRAYCVMNGFKFRWGGDWDGDSNFNDQKFDDLQHFEITMS